MIYRGLLICFLMLSAIVQLSSQSTQQLSPQAVKGVEAFKKGRYNIALSEFRSLLERYPKDPVYLYYAGASLLMSNSDISQGLELLKAASTKDVPHDVFYYLGLGHYRLYKFDNALSYYEQFKAEASISKLRESGINQEIQRVKFVQPYLKTVTIPIVVGKTAILDSQSMYSSLPSVSFRSCPSYAVNCNNILIKDSLNKGDYAYYSAFRTYKIRGKELFRIKHHGNNNWSDSEAIGALNTMQDDDFPYFDKKNQVLYFSSKGYQGYGGYDIYKSRYDSLANSWSKPENLGFPINSPFDDIYYLPDEATGITTLVSNRDCESEKFIVYKLMNNGIYQVKDIRLAQELVDISKLAVNAKEKERLQFARSSSVKKVEPKPEIKTADPGRTKETSNKKNQMVSKYIEAISHGLLAQAESDSLLRISDALRLQASGTPDDTERGKLQKQITILEMQAKDLQSTADKYYTVAREMELEHRSQQKSPVYQKPKEEKTKAETDEKAMQFDILPSSPYSETNPIRFDVPMPEGVLYKIQLAAINKIAPFDQFGGLKPITGEHMGDGVINKYYVGWFSEYVEADAALKKVHEKGYKQAFIVAYYNGSKLPVSRAKTMEKED